MTLAIERATGRVSLGRLVLAPGTTEDAFFGERGLTRASGGNGEWTAYDIREDAGGGAGVFLGTVHFHAGTVAMLRFQLDAGPSDWGSWNEADERALVEVHDRILAKLLGGAPPYTFPWGEVASSYDPRSGASQITVRYGRSS